MGRPRKTQADKPAHGLHFIAEWAERRGLKQGDFIKGLDVDKGTVSRWFSGKLPDETNLPRIAALLHIEIADLFRVPDDDWMRRFFQNRSIEELKRMKDTLEAAFPVPKKDGTHN